MKKNVTEIRVIYADTDAMGIVYHTNYIKWFEVGRNEFMRENGFKYTEIEAAGFSLPATEVVAHFLASARYDDIVLIETSLGNFRRANIKFEYEIWDEKRQTLLAEGSTLHSFVKDGKITRPPDVFADKLGTLMEQKNKNSAQER